MFPLFTSTYDEIILTSKQQSSHLKPNSSRFDISKEHQKSRNAEEFSMDEKTKPAPELLLAQLILGAILMVVVGHATYEKDYEIPRYVFQVQNGRPSFQQQGMRIISINEFRTSYTVLLLLMVAAAYFFINLLLYLTCKCTLHIYDTNLILIQDVVFCFLMFVCSIAAVSNPGERAVKSRETEILIASGISMFCCVSSGVGVYYSYRVYKGL